MKKLINSDINKLAFYSLMVISLGVLFSFQNCGKVKFNSLRTDAVTPQSCGTIDMTPPNGLYSVTNVTFEVVPATGITVTDISWEFTKANQVVFTSTTNPVSHTFNGATEGPGDYFATAKFIKSDGNGCELTKSFQILEGDLCADPSGISGPLTGFVDEETSPFSIASEACFNGTVSWDMDNDGNPEFRNLPVGDSVTHIYTAPGNYTIRAIVINNEDNSEITLTHPIIVRHQSCVNPFSSHIVLHGQTVTFAKPSTQCGTACETAPRECNNGQFVGDTTFNQNPATCQVSAPCPCTNGAINPPACNQCPTGQVLMNGTCVTPPTLPPEPPPTPVTYSWSTGNWGHCSATACGSSGTQTRSVICKSNTGTTVSDNLCTQPKPQTSRSCSARPCNSCSLPWGGTVTHGQNVVAYQASQVACGQTCTKQTRTCSDGTLSGSYTKQNCSVAACAVNGVCGSSHGKTLSSKPTSNLCSKGSASAVSTTSSQYTWTCSGQNGGSNASCSANRKHFEVAGCGFGLNSSNWVGSPGQPTTVYGSCEWAGSMTMGSSNKVDATFYIGDFYDNSGPYGIFRLNNPDQWTITATGCTIGQIVDPKNYRKIMPNYCRANGGFRTYTGTPLVWNATITATHKTTGEVKTIPIKATFKPTLNGGSGGSNPPPGGSNPTPPGGGGGGGGSGPKGPGNPQLPQ